MNSDFFIFLSLSISAFTLTFLFYYFVLYKRTKDKYFEQQKAEIIGQRRRLEDQIYELEKIMLSDPDRLFENSKLLLQFPDKDLTINNAIPNYSFFYNLGIDIKDISIKDKSVFCLMPFHKSFNKINEIIHSTCLKNGYEYWRSDTPFSPGKVLQQIIKMMFDAQLIVAVLDGKNPNVFYEIGIAHSIGKTVILIANVSKIDEIPFDLRSDRLLLYTNPNDLSKKLSEILENIHYAE
ncbi:MAG: hypothetical protein K2O17_07840 [Bacteroidaceae bacterium]|nr:hypothetical protein [Bacteroidaceae bacterium]